MEYDSQGTARWARKVIQEKIDHIIEEGIKKADARNQVEVGRIEVDAVSREKGW